MENAVSLKNTLAHYERKKVHLVYEKLPVKMKNLLKQNIELTEEEFKRAEDRVVMEGITQHKCKMCDSLFNTRFSACRHSRIAHSTKPLMYVCGYGKCTMASNNTTSIQRHTLSHFFNVMKEFNM